MQGRFLGRAEGATVDPCPFRACAVDHIQSGLERLSFDPPVSSVSVAYHTTVTVDYLVTVVWYATLTLDAFRSKNRPSASAVCRAC